MFLPALTACSSIPPVSYSGGSAYSDILTGATAGGLQPGKSEILRERIARFDPEKLLSQPDLQSISLHLFDDLRLTARQEKEQKDSGLLVWSGKIEGAGGGKLVLVVREGFLYASVYLRSSIIQIRPVAALAREASRDYVVRELACPGKSSSSAPREGVCPDGGSGSGPTPGEIRLIELVNLEREADGLRVLGLSSRLTEAARRHARDMARHDCCSHELSTGEQFYENVFESGYPTSTVGENLAVGYATPEETFECMFASPEHRSNIMNPRYTQIGVGEVFDATGRYRYFWAQEFGSAS
ncbi:MAG: CAP domain-containing protein [Syntrophobacteraceae bacterium]|nr:CAP domain-containing protein [Syntrophobacteraceae bacterium]